MRLSNVSVNTTRKIISQLKLISHRLNVIVYRYMFRSSWDHHQAVYIIDTIKLIEISIRDIAVPAEVWPGDRLSTSQRPCVLSQLAGSHALMRQFLRVPTLIPTFRSGYVRYRVGTSYYCVSRFTLYMHDDLYWNVTLYANGCYLDRTESWCTWLLQKLLWAWMRHLKHEQPLFLLFKVISRVLLIKSLQMTPTSRFEKGWKCIFVFQG
jgi:hypothetical protein